MGWGAWADPGQAKMPDDPRTVRDQSLLTPLGECWHRSQLYVGVGAAVRNWWQELPGVDSLYHDLQLVYQVGPWTAAHLRRTGVDDLRQLTDHPRFAASAQTVLAAIAQAAAAELAQRGAPTPALLSLYQPEQLLFLDLETTGLTGSSPLFLVGVATLDGQDLRVDQFLARRTDEEGAVVAATVQRCAPHPVVCVFNGKGFDLPFLRQRSWFWRQPWPWNPWPVDLLTPSRRRYRYILPDCRLATICRQVLGRPRTDDIPGWKIPEQYQQFVQEGDWALIEPILQHNAEDLVALALLLRQVYPTAQSQSSRTAGETDVAPRSATSSEPGKVEVG